MSVECLRATSKKRAATVAHRPERLLTRNGLEDLVVVPGIARLLWLLDLDKVHVVYHPTVKADETAIGEEIVDRHVAHLGNDGLRLVATERIDRFEIMGHRRIDAGLRLSRHHAALRKEAL